MQSLMRRVGVHGEWEIENIALEPDVKKKSSFEDYYLCELHSIIVELL